MEKQKLKGGQEMKNNKSKTALIWTIAGLFLMVALVTAATTINNNGATFSTNDAVMSFNGYSSILGNGAGGINFIQTRPEAKSGMSWYGYDSATNTNRYIGWMVCHYNSSSGNGVHSHCSIETLDNSTGSPTINSHLAITYAGNQSLATISFPSSNVVFTADRGVYFNSGLTSNIQRITSSNKLEISDANAVSLKAGARIDLYPESNAGVGIRIANDSTGVINSVLGGTTFSISSSDMLQLKANSTAMTCDSDHEGSLYYDGSTKKHYGCNSTDWNSLY